MIVLHTETRGLRHLAGLHRDHFDIYVQAVREMEGEGGGVPM